MDDDTTIKLVRPQNIPFSSHEIQDQPQPEQSSAAIDDEPTITLKPDSPDNLPPLEYEQTWNSSTAPISDEKRKTVPLPTTVTPAPLKKTRKGRRRWPKWLKVVATIFLVLLILVGGVAGFGYYYFDTNFQKPLQKIIRPVSRGKEEQHLKIQP